MKIKRIAMSLIGVVVTAISVGAFKFAAIGVDPFQSFMTGVDRLIPIEFGTLYVLVNALLLLFALIFDRRYIGISTFINLFLLGYIVEFTLDALTAAFPAASILAKAAAFSLGFISLCFGSSMYMTANMGVSTYDAIALICTYKWKLGKFKYIRIISDFVCILTGTAMYLFGGGPVTGVTAFVGIGTVLTAFFMGPLIDWFNQRICVPLLEKRHSHS